MSDSTEVRKRAGAIFISAVAARLLKSIQEIMIFKRFAKKLEKKPAASKYITVFARPRFGVLLSISIIIISFIISI